MIRRATMEELELLCGLDRHIGRCAMAACIESGRVLVSFAEDDVIAGWLRFGFFWGTIPFLDLLFIVEPYRRLGYGTLLMRVWEHEMRETGAHLVLVSTQVDEDAQHFYRKLSYADCGMMLLPDQPAELFLCKDLRHCSL